MVMGTTATQLLLHRRTHRNGPDDQPSYIFIFV